MSYEESPPEYTEPLARKGSTVRIQIPVRQLHYFIQHQIWTCS